MFRLVSQIRDATLNEFRVAGLGVAEFEKLRTLDVSDLVIVYMNWRNRRVLQRPRRIHLSRQLKDNPSFQIHEAVVRKLMGMAQSGGDFGPYLSKAVRKYPYVLGTTSATKDKDHLLNDWGIHHLHLGAKTDADESEYVKRTKELLFVIFAELDAYFIDIGEHRFADRSLAETVVSNWPAAELIVELKGILPPSVKDQWKPEEVVSIRKGGIASYIPIGDKVYLSLRGGLTTAGTSQLVSRRAMDIFRVLRALEKAVKEARGTPLTFNGVHLPRRPRLEFRWTPGSALVLEVTSGLVIAEWAV